MAKPIILTVDDDADVLQAIGRDLRHQYGDRFRIVRADSGASAIAAVEQLKLHNESVALFLADQRMPQMNGVEFLARRLNSFQPQNVLCSRPMPIRTRQFRPSTPFRLTTTYSNRGIRPKKDSIQC
jgi:CheY-like chemotaxis protein